MSVLLAAGFALSACAMAVDITPLLAPEAPLPAAPPPAPPEEEAPDAEKKKPDPDKVIVKAIRGIRFELFQVDTKKQPSDGQTFQPVEAIPESERHVSDLNNVENAVPALSEDLMKGDSELRRAVDAALTGPLTWRVLDELLVQTTKTARGYGWSLAQSITPEQELTKGPLRITVVPVHLESVAVEGARWSNPERLHRRLVPSVGKVVHLPDYGPPMSLFNQHPFRSVTPLLAPGAITGTTKLGLKVTESKPWQVFTDYDTTHSRTSGTGRLSTGFIAAAPWRTDDIITMRYSKDNKLDHLDSASVMYRAALPWGHFLSLTGLISKSDTAPNQWMDQISRDYMIRVGYSIPLPEWRGWTHEVELGLEWRRTVKQMDFIGMRFSDARLDAAPFSLGWRGQRGDLFGATSVSVSARANPGDWVGGYMDRESYLINRLDAKPAWALLDWSIRRDWRLPRGFIAMNRFWGQVGSGRMADPAQFFLGGNRSIRGYRESELSGDGGLGFTTELYSPALRLPKIKDPKNPPKEQFSARVLGFWDWGQMRNRGPLDAGERKRQTVAGAGLGVRLAYGSKVDVRVDYGWRLRDTGVKKDDVTGRWHVSVHFAF